MPTLWQLVGVVTCCYSSRTSSQPRTINPSTSVLRTLILSPLRRLSTPISVMTSRASRVATHDRFGGDLLALALERVEPAVEVDQCRRLAAGFQRRRADSGDPLQALHQRMSLGLAIAGRSACRRTS